MDWFFLAVGSTFLDTLVLFVDRYVVEKEAGDVGSLPIITSTVSLLVGLFYWVISGFTGMDVLPTLAVLTAGMLMLWANTLYFLSVPRQQSSVIIMAFQLHPVFVLVLSWLFLQDCVTLQQLAGFALIIISVTLLSLERMKTSGRFQISSAFFLLLSSTVIYAVATILLKWATYEYSVLTIAAHQGFGIALGGISILALPHVRRGMQRVLRQNPFKVIGIMSLNEGASQVSKLLRLAAISAGPVALVSAVGSTRVFLGVWLGALLTSISPMIFKEDIRRGSLALKTLMSLLTIIGLWFLYL